MPHQKEEDLFFVININWIFHIINYKISFRPKRVSQITKYRQLLGGFININQIKEVYSINDYLFESIKDCLVVKDSTLKQVKINLCSV